MNPLRPFIGNKLAIERFSMRDYFYSVAKSRRLTTSVNCLKKEYRKFLTYEGEPLILDISNCQPYLVQILVDSKFWNNQHEHFNIVDIRRHQISSKYFRSLQLSLGTCSPMLRKMDKIRSSHGFQRYVSDVATPGFYQRFFEAHGPF